MGSKSQWKAVERRVLALFGLVRTGPTGRNDADGKSPEGKKPTPLAVEVKSRKGIMSVPEKHLLQAEKNAKGRIPIVVVHHDNCRYGNEHAIMRVKDLVTVLKRAGLVDEETG